MQEWRRRTGDCRQRDSRRASKPLSSPVVTEPFDRDAVLASNEALAAALAAHTKLLTDAAAKIEALNEKMDVLSDDMDRLRSRLPEN